MAELCDEVVVMYAGRAVERADIFELFDHPRHPYTHGLMASIPRGGAGRGADGPGMARRGEETRCGQAGTFEPFRRV